jgi:hypothetical protein
MAPCHCAYLRGLICIVRGGPELVLRAVSGSLGGAVTKASCTVQLVKVAPTHKARTSALVSGRYRSYLFNHPVVDNVTVAIWL